MTQQQEQQQRTLYSSSSGYKSPYFKDSSGNEYESYALSWRYLGIFIDCDSSSSCPRKLLWAAYQDPNYSGASIGEYQYYNWNYKSWDASTCQTDRCAKMDCHDDDTETWQLVGVYKASVEFDNDTWFEQLFKHEGYCLWDGDKQSSYSTNGDYSFMQTLREQWPDECTELSDIQNYNGRSYYLGTKPLAGGDMTMGIYTDSNCQYESNLSYYDYQRKVANRSTAKNWGKSLERWNSLMTAYKVCQPCRAYNKVATYEDRRRSLVEYEDGQGEEEQYGYNCYDDADYRNCNQCYKFDTHTDMEVASSSDLASASQQGTILSIRYTDGTYYGSGSADDESQTNYYTSTWSTGGESSAVATGFGVVVLLFGVLLVARRLFGGKRSAVAVGTEPPSALRQTLSPSNGVVV